MRVNCPDACGHCGMSMDKLAHLSPFFTRHFFHPKRLFSELGMDFAGVIGRDR